MDYTALGNRVHSYDSNQNHCTCILMYSFTLTILLQSSCEYQLKLTRNMCLIHIHTQNQQLKVQTCMQFLLIDMWSKCVHDPIMERAATSITHARITEESNDMPTTGKTCGVHLQHDYNATFLQNNDTIYHRGNLNANIVICTNTHLCIYNWFKQ